MSKVTRVQEHLDAHTRPHSAKLLSVSVHPKVLLTTVEFGVFTQLANRSMIGDCWGADFQKWCKEADSQRFDVIHLAGPSRAAIAYE